MTSEEAIEQLDAMPENGDEEILHGDAETILLERLHTLDESALVAAFKRAKDRVGFWYA